MPAQADLERAARTWGLNDGDIVIGYDDNRSVPAARLWWLLHRCGVDAETDVAVHCSSGVVSMHSALGLKRPGIPARVYAGSWSQWSNTRGRAVVLGILPSGRLATV